ncbi:MAG: hypothetical protein KAV00_12995, partial [Phycisphaerae bacterium]|nr:hypothetical protein [Phycisphaerae bacterium]
MGRATSVLLVALAVVVTASLLVLVSGNSEKSGIVPGPGAEGAVGGTSAGSPINSSTESGYTPLPEGTVRLWDLGQAYGSGLSMAFVGWADRANWTQIAYGETPGSVANDVALEGPSFFFNITWRPDSYISGPVLYRKPAPSDPNLPRHNLLYRGWYTPSGLWAGGANLGYIKVLKNTPQEVLVQSAGKLSYRDPLATAQVIANYGVRADKPWLEVTPVSQCSTIGMHGESRFIILPEGMADGTDYAYDALNDQEQDEQNPLTVVPENSAKMLLDFIMDDDNLWALMITPADPNSGPDTGMPSAYRIRRFMLSNQVDGYNAGWSHIGEGNCWRVVSAPYAFFMGQKIVIGHLRIGYWHYQKIASPVTQGADLTINWQYRYERTVVGSPFTTGGPWWPMYAGKWRMVSRINGQYHTQQVTITQADVGNSEFTFHSPATGNLEYVLFYLYDRT